MPIYEVFHRAVGHCLFHWQTPKIFAAAHFWHTRCYNKSSVKHILRYVHNYYKYKAAHIQIKFKIKNKKLGAGAGKCQLNSANRCIQTKSKPTITSITVLLGRSGFMNFWITILKLNFELAFLSVFTNRASVRTLYNTRTSLLSYFSLSITFCHYRSVGVFYIFLKTVFKIGRLIFF